MEELLLEHGVGWEFEVQEVVELQIARVEEPLLEHAAEQEFEALELVALDWARVEELLLELEVEQGVEIERKRLLYAFADFYSVFVWIVQHWIMEEELPVELLIQLWMQKMLRL